MDSSTTEKSPLGKPADWPQHHDPDLLFPIPRSQARADLGPHAAAAFVGCDIWHAWELSWLDARGKPVNAVARFHMDCHNPQLVESKSFKLYLNSLAQERFESGADIRALLERDVQAVTGGRVVAQLLEPTDVTQLALAPLSGQLLDELPIEIDCYAPPQPHHLHADAATRAEESLVSHLFRSTCPVTGQPDWASVHIAYQGPHIEHAGLLRYLLSFRRHSGFHEQCVERIFTDIRTRCMPEWLDVYACFTRRGGLDISPWRSSRQAAPTQVARDPRQ